MKRSTLDKFYLVILHGEYTHGNFFLIPEKLVDKQNLEDMKFAAECESPEGPPIHWVEKICFREDGESKEDQMKKEDEILAKYGACMTEKDPSRRFKYAKTEDEANTNNARFDRITEEFEKTTGKFFEYSVLWNNVEGCFVVKTFVWTSVL